MPDQISVLFVCLGNICRSTMAEGIFQSVARKPPYKDLVDKIDSCGTGAWHVGEPPDSRTMSTLEDNGITDYEHLGRQLRKSDFDEFDYVFAMDRSNLADIQRLKRSKGGECRAKVMLWGEHSGSQSAEVVQDPYYGGRNGFDKAFEQCTRFTKNFLKEVFPAVTPP